MLEHAPPGYVCPFCALVSGLDRERNRQNDIVLRDDETTAFVAPKWWRGNEGHVLVIPNDHHENIYGIPRTALAAVYSAAATIARAVRDTYGCDGTSMRQHNEPGGGQDVWHFHVHVFPRYVDDDLYRNHARTRWAAPEERAIYATRLRNVLADYPPRS